MHGVSGGVQSALQGGNFYSGFAGGALASMAGSGAQWAGWSDAGIVNATTAGEAIGSLAFGGDWYSGASLGFSIGTLNHSWRVNDDGYVYDINSWWDNFLDTGAWINIREVWSNNALQTSL